MPFDIDAFIRRVEAANVKPNCLACGSSAVTYSAKRYVLLDLDEHDRIAADEELALTAGTICGAVVCGECGYVHLHSLAVLEERDTDGL